MTSDIDYAYSGQIDLYPDLGVLVIIRRKLKFNEKFTIQNMTPKL